MNLTIVGDHEDDTIAQMRQCMQDPRATAGVLCADGHYGFNHPVGGSIAYRDAISVSGVGFDIACGNMAIKTNVEARALRQRDWLALADKIRRNFSFGIGRSNEASSATLPLDRSLIDDEAHEAWRIPFLAAFKQKAAAQLGTVGSGNHYIDVFEGRDGAVWVGNHFGSRGLGHAIATHYMDAAEPNGSRKPMQAGPVMLDVTTDLGREYLIAMDLAGRYAYAGREWVARSVVHMLGGEIVDEVHNHHNFAWLEDVKGAPHWVVRKGATPLFPGQRGFVGGSMGDISVILRGVHHGRDGLLNSTIHGAGRVMSRTKAAGKIRWVKGRQTRITSGIVDEAAWRKRLSADGLILIGAGADEMPEVYRPLESVLAHHAGTCDVEDVLKPRIVAMAGADEFDPYKD